MAVRQRIMVEDTPGLDDESLAATARANPDAFGVLYDRYHDVIFRYCNRRLNDDARAADAAAQVFSRAWASIDRFRGGGSLSFRAWLCTIARRIVVDEYRCKSSEPIELAVDLEESNISYLPDPAAERLTRREKLRQALAHLSDEQRHIVELRLSGLNGAEIAAALGRTHSAIKSSQFRAYCKLRELLVDIEEL